MKVAKAVDYAQAISCGYKVGFQNPLDGENSDINFVDSEDFQEMMEDIYTTEGLQEVKESEKFYVLVAYNLYSK